VADDSQAELELSPASTQCSSPPRHSLPADVPGEADDEEDKKKKRKKKKR
jgi:hypothetical protein